MKSSAEDVDRHVEDVSRAPLSLDVFGMRWIRLDLASQPENLDVDGAVVDFGAIEPRQVEQLIPRQDPFRRDAERLQQAELAVRELDALPLRRHEAARAQVELPPAEP